MEAIVEKLIQRALEKSESYKEYRAKLDQDVITIKAADETQIDDLKAYSLLNQQRMKRLDKRIELNDQIKARLETLQVPVIWLVLVETWCGDGAQSLPILNKLAEVSPMISLKIALRDEHPALMDHFLTDGGRSIPKLIMLNESVTEVLDIWGPRPAVATAMVKEFKLKHGTLTPEFKTELQQWYTKDKGVSIMEDILKILPLE